MDNNKYLSQLEKRLRKLPPEDRADAISYYAEYLAEAGAGGADQAIKSLGTPAQVAAGIMADFTMRGFDGEKPKVRKGISAVWFAIIGVFAIPVALPVAIVLACVVFAVLIVIFSVIVSLYASSVAIVVSGFAAAIAGVVIVPQDISSALFYIGAGLVLMGVGILMFIAVNALMKVTLKGVAKMFNAIRFRKINKQARKNLQAQQSPFASQNPEQQEVQQQAPFAPQEPAEPSTQTAPIPSTELEGESNE